MDQKVTKVPEPFGVHWVGLKLGPVGGEFSILSAVAHYHFIIKSLETKDSNKYFHQCL
jgi:hypothetical protein